MTYEVCYNQNDELYHHGILGQKWGIRRYQNKDGSLTPAGKKRYENIDELKAKVQEAKKKVKALPRKHTEQQAEEATRSLYLAKRDLAFQKSKNALALSNGKKSSHRLKLEEKYKEKGMSDEEAAVYAYRREKAEKYVVAAAGVAALTAASVAAYKHYDKTVDKFIKSDELLKRVTLDGNKTLNDTFYAARKEKDAKRYVGLYGTELRRRSSGKDVFQDKIKVLDTMKVASEKNATKVLSDLASNDSEFKSKLHSDIKKLAGMLEGKQGRAINKAIRSIDKGKIDNNVYRALNLNLVGNTSDTATKFYNHLRKFGYDAIQDVNDRSLSGYNTKSATIVFNKAKTTVESVRTIPIKEIQRQYNTEMAKTFVEAQGATILATYGGLKGIQLTTNKIINDREDTRIVSEYRKEHPNTQLSYNEILRAYQSGGK